MRDLNLVLFDQVGRSYRARVTIRNNGQIGFNEGAKAKYSLEQFYWAQLLFDSENQVVAIRFHKEEPAKGAMKVLKRPGNFAISARSFFDYHDINYKDKKDQGERRTFDLSQFERAENTFYFELGGET